MAIQNQTHTQDVLLINLMNELLDVMEKEIEIIERHDFKELAPLATRKQKLQMDYVAEHKSVTQKPDWLLALPEHQKSMLRSLSAKMENVGRKNAITVKAAMLASQKLMQSIMTTVRRQQLGDSGYSEVLNNAPPTTMKPTLYKTTV